MTFRQMIQQMVEKEFEQNAADVQGMKHGRWERKYRANFMCSVCNYWVKTTDEYGNTIDGDMDDYKYCPNCGAKMDEVTK